MKILAISLTPTHPANAGNRARILEMCRALKDAGHDLHFVFSPREEGNEVAMKAFFGESKFHVVPYEKSKFETNFFCRVLRKFGRLANLESAYRFGIDAWYPHSLSTYLKNISSNMKFDMVLVEYIFLTAAFRHFPDTLKVCDTHDRFADRHRIYLEAGRKPNWFSTTQAEEKRAIKRADAVIAIQDTEKQYFSETLGHPLVVRIGHLAPINERPHNHSKTANLLFVASDNVINVDGIRYFIDHTLPLIAKKRPDVKLVLAGTICRAIPDSPRVEKLNFVPDLNDAYSNTAVVINPIQYGTGLNIKTIEALGSGIPLACTEAGSRGLEDHRNHAFLCAGDSDHETMSAIILRFLEDPRSSIEFGEKGLALAKQWNSEQIRELSNLLNRNVSQSKSEGK